MNEDVVAAVRAVPWLANLRTLLGRGTWVKLARTTTGGDLDALAYSRVWPDFTGDALLLRSETDACAIRLDGDGYQLWSATGAARSVIEALLELPDPGARNAPAPARGQVTGLFRWPARELGR